MKRILFLLALAACGTVDSQMVYPIIIQEHVALRAGKDARQCFAVEANQSVRYRYKASLPIDFSLRQEEGIVEKEKRAHVAGGEMAEFRPTEPGRWCWHWSSGAKASAQLSYEIEIDAPVASTTR